LETLTKLQEQFFHLPIVVMTGLGDDELGRRAAELGAQDYLVKGQVQSGLLARSLSYAIARKHADEELRDKEQFLARLVELNPALICVTDVATNKEVYSSGSGLQWLGYETSDRRGLQGFAKSVFFPGDWDKLCAATNELLRQDKKTPLETQIRLKTVDGNWLYAAIVQVVFKRDRTGSPLQIMSIVRDISAYKRLEEELRCRSDELKESNEELEAFTYSVSHDLRAPLRHICSFAELLSTEAGAILDDSCKTHLETIRSSGHHMGELLEGLLKLSRLGKQELHVTTCSINSLIEETLKDMASDISDRQVDWRVGQLPSIRCDCTLIKQVFVNLISNALKFTRSRQLAVIEIGQLSTAADLTIFVRDNGVGFNMKYADKLFGVFQRLHKRDEFEGTGVGLSIVQRIVRRHGGRVWAEAETNHGATFYFTLPDSVPQPDTLSQCQTATVAHTRVR
jgi:PAS domain S-box-containing protein